MNHNVGFIVGCTKTVSGRVSSHIQYGMQSIKAMLLIIPRQFKNDFFKSTKALRNQILEEDGI